MQMIRTQHAARALIAALFVVASACQMVSIKDPMHREDMFNDAMRTFTQYVRWGNFNGAAEYLVDEQRDDFIDLAPELSDVRFTDYEILRQDLNEERTEATVEVVLTGYRMSSPISRTMRLHQEWKRSGGTDWKVSVELGPLREALGLAAQ
jgi:hypothetical protein